MVYMRSAYLLIQSRVFLSTSTVLCLLLIFDNLYHAVAFFAANKDVYNIHVGLLNMMPPDVFSEVKMITNALMAGVPPDPLPGLRDRKGKGEEGTGKRGKADTGGVEERRGKAGEGTEREKEAREGGKGRGRCGPLASAPRSASDPELPSIVYGMYRNLILST